MHAKKDARQRSLRTAHARMRAKRLFDRLTVKENGQSEPVSKGNVNDIFISLFLLMELPDQSHEIHIPLRGRTLNKFSTTL